MYQTYKVNEDGSMVPVHVVHMTDKELEEFERFKNPVRVVLSEPSTDYTHKYASVSDKLARNFAQVFKDNKFSRAKTAKALKITKHSVDVYEKAAKDRGLL